MIVFNEEMHINRGETYKHSYYLSENTGQLIQTETYTPSMFIEDSKTGRTAVDFTLYLDKDTFSDVGVILLVIPSDVTKTLNFNKGVYDLVVRSVNDEVYKVAEGRVNITDMVTSNA